MKERFINSSLELINKYQECDHLKTVKLKYGLEGLYNFVIKFIIVFTIAIILKTLPETLLFLLFYAGIRTFSFGFHANSSLGCWISTLIIYNLIPLIIHNLAIPKYVGYITGIISILTFSLFAPADTPKRPLIKKEMRQKCKLTSISIILIYLIIYYFSTNNLINNAIVYALIIQNILINPITYKITKTKFNNYKYYHSKN